MAVYLLDTTVLVHFWRDVPAVRAWVRAAGGEGAMLGTSSVNVAEVYSGAKVIDRPTWEAFFSSFPVWGVGSEEASLAGRLRFDLARQGTQVHLPASLVAAVARLRGATIVTADVKDFRAMNAEFLELGA